MIVLKRMLLVLALAAVVLVQAAASEAAPKPKGKLKARRGHPVYIFSDSTFVPGEVNRIPIVTFVNTTTAADAVSKFFPILEETLRHKPHFVVINPARTEAEAGQKGVVDDHRALVRQWDGGREFVPETVRKMATALNAAYLMGGEISEWESEQIPWNVEGYSHSDVEVHLKIFSGKTGELVWEARDKVELRGGHHDPAASQGVVDDLGIQRGKGQIVPPPPPIDEAAKQAAENLVGALP
jgi:hypothetical protein